MVGDHGTCSLQLDCSMLCCAVAVLTGWLAGRRYSYACDAATAQACDGDRGCSSNVVGLGRPASPALEVSGMHADHGSGQRVVRILTHACYLVIGRQHHANVTAPKGTTSCAMLHAQASKLHAHASSQELLTSHSTKHTRA
jgi:hypothetical protein